MLLMKGYIMQVNDILVSKWGYEQTNIDFYKVIKVTNKMVTIQKLDTIELNDETMSCWKMPLDKVKEKSFRRKIHNFNSEEFIYINSYSIAKKWNCKKERCTSYS